MLKLAVLASVLGLMLVDSQPAVAQAGLAVSRAADARPMPGDRIYVHILREPLLSDTVTVNERGEAAFPKLGTFIVGSMSVRQLSDSLRTRYAEYLRTPELEIVVLRRVIVNGEVAKPNVYLLDVSSTLADAIARAGGFTEAAKRNDISILRRGQRVRINNWDRGGATTLELLSGDEIVVGRRSWLSLNALAAASTAAVFVSLALAFR